MAINPSDGSVSNGNIFYFSWMGFLTSSVLLISFLQSAMQVYVPSELSSSRFKYWATLFASSIVVLGSSGDFFNRMCGGSGGRNYCNRCILGIITGSFTTLLSLIIIIMTIMKGHVPFVIECGSSLIMLVFNALTVGFLTSDKGPGAPLGNLYYFSWLSFVLVWVIGYGCWEDYKCHEEVMERDESEERTMKVDNRRKGIGESVEETDKMEDVEDVDLER